MIRLFVEDSQGTFAEVPVSAGQITIGRNQNNTIVLGEKTISRTHLRIVADQEGLLVEDRSRYNGMRMNGEELEGSARLQIGDVVDIGDYSMQVRGKNQQPVVQFGRRRFDGLPLLEISDVTAPIVLEEHISRQPKQTLKIEQTVELEAAQTSTALDLRWSRRDWLVFAGTTIVGSVVFVSVVFFVLKPMFIQRGWM